MKNQIFVFVIRWLLNSTGLWIAVRLLGSGYSGISISLGFLGFLIAGLVFSLINSLVKPFLVILSLPAIMLSLGLFIVIVNGVLVYISLKLAPDISMSFLNSIFTGIILSLINYIVSATLSLRTNVSK